MRRCASRPSGRLAALDPACTVSSKCALRTILTIWTGQIRHPRAACMPAYPVGGSSEIFSELVAACVTISAELVSACITCQAMSAGRQSYCHTKPWAMLWLFYRTLIFFLFDHRTNDIMLRPQVFGTSTVSAVTLGLICIGAFAVSVGQNCAQQHTDERCRFAAVWQHSVSYFQSSVWIRHARRQLSSDCRLVAIWNWCALAVVCTPSLGLLMVCFEACALA